MDNFYKYLSFDKYDGHLGLTLLNAGFLHVRPSAEYPFKAHPNHHNFSWTQGRVLQEYQILYITRGQGLFESDHQKQIQVKAGYVLFLFPNERHRYKPDDTTGWDEYWIGIEGKTVDSLFGAGYFKKETPCLYIGFHSEIVNIYNIILESSKAELPGYQTHISGAALHLLGAIHAISNQQGLQKNDVALLINHAKLLFRSNIDKFYTPEMAAAELNISYSTFRKQFKDYTGISPKQYYIELKIERAKLQLSETSHTIKTIAADLNFDSSLYFATAFREKTGMTPSQYRDQNRKAKANS